MQHEQELISRIVNGDLAAFKLLIKQYERLVMHMIGRILQNHHDSQDACQEVFIKVYKNLPSFKQQSKLSTWIAQIAFSTAIDIAKKKNRTGNLTDDISDFENYHQTIDDPESILAKKDTAAFVHRLIERLPMQYRTVLTLYHLNEFSYQEIETITGMPEGTVKSYLFRARKLLKEKLQLYIKSDERVG